MQLHRMSLIALGLLGSLGPCLGQAKRPGGAKLPEGVSIQRDLEYGTHERHKLDVYTPKGDGPFPVVVWVHGGAWSAGSKEGGGPAIQLLEHGYAVAAIHYRFSQQAKFPAQIEDCKSAIRHLRANAKKYKLDAEHLGVWGSSAGGHLVALLGTSAEVKELEGDGKNEKQSSRVQCVVDWFGPTDLLKMKEQTTVKGPIDHNAKDSPESKLIGGAVQENKEKAKKANPIEYVSADDPPFLIVHGDQDPLVPLAQSEILAEALQKAKVSVELVVLKGAKHGGPEFNSKAQFEKTLAFLDQHLKPKK
jgi:acetyl esterase/lipase